MLAGITDPDTDSINLYVKVGETLTLIGSTSDITPEDGPSTWTISVNPDDLADGDNTLVAKAVIGGVESEESESVTVTLDCDVPIPEITNSPEGDVTNCEENFDVSGTTDPDTDSINLYVKVGETLTLIGSTSDITPEDGPSTWTISVNPDDLADGDNTLVAKAVIGGVESEESESVTVTLDCDVPIPEITNSPEGDVTNCEENFDVSGTTDPDTDSINLYVKVGETLTLIGSTSDITPEDGPSTWTISVNPDDLADGDNTLVAKAVIGGVESEESESVTVTLDCDVPIPEITNSPEGDVTNCEENFDVSGTTDPDTDSINLYVKVGETLTLIGGTFPTSLLKMDLQHGQFQ